MYRELYSDDSIVAVAVLEYESSLVGLVVNFKSMVARKLHYKLNSSMFVYKGRWFKGEVEIDNESSIFLRVDHYGYIIRDGQDAYFKEVSDISRL
jgi:hypothetical protein